MSDMDTFKVTIRMFMEFGLINQFQIPYKVRKELNTLLFNLQASLWKMTWLSTEMRSSSVNGKFVQRRPSIKIQNARLKTRIRGLYFYFRSMEEGKSLSSAVIALFFAKEIVNSSLAKLSMISLGFSYFSLSLCWWSQLGLRSFFSVLLPETGTE